MTARQLVPGIEAYPELEKQLASRLSMQGGGNGCSSCALNQLSRSFRARLNAMVERDKLSGRR